MDDPFAMSRTQSIGNLNRQTEQISTDKPPGVDGRSSPRFVGQPELSSDTLCLTVLCELYERKTAIFRPSKVPLLSILIEVFAGSLLHGVFSSPLISSYLPVSHQ